MSVEEIERYNVLADEIRKLGAKLEKAEKSRQEACNAQQQALYAYIGNHTALLMHNLGAIEKRLESIGRELEPLAIKGLIAQTKQEMLIKRERQRARAGRRQRRSKR